MGIIRRNLQARPKILKKLLKRQINQSKHKISQKKLCSVPYKLKGAKNLCGAPGRNLQARPKIRKKIIRISNQPIRFIIFQKQVWLEPLKWKGAKNLYGSYPTELAGSTQNPKKNYLNAKSIRTKIFPKNYVFYTLKVKRSQTF
jgi:hypothetical protein